MKVSLIIPAKDEEEVIAQTIRNISQKMKGDYEVIVINDHSKDKTKQIVKELEKKYKWIRIIDNYGKGVGQAILTGIKESKGDAVVPVMADLCDRIEDIPKMGEKMEKGSLDVVCGSRYMKGGNLVNGVPVKSFFSWLCGLVFKNTIGIPTSDSTNAFKMYKKKIFKKFWPRHDSFSISLEMVLLAHLHGFKVGEIPTSWLGRTKGKSKFKFLKQGKSYLKLWFIGIARKK